MEGFKYLHLLKCLLDREYLYFIKFLKKGYSTYLLIISIYLEFLRTFMLNIEKSNV